jgi:hypothetical protein
MIIVMVFLVKDEQMMKIFVYVHLQVVLGIFQVMELILHMMVGKDGLIDYLQQILFIMICLIF